MTSTFRATKCSATQEPWGYRTVLAAPSSKDDDFYLMLQRPYEFSEDAIRWDQAEPYIEFCGQGWSWYGHIERFQLGRDKITIQMDEIAASEMRSDGKIEVTFSLDDNAFDVLQTALARTFAGFPYFHAA